MDKEDSLLNYYQHSYNDNYNTTNNNNNNTTNFNENVQHFLAPPTFYPRERLLSNSSFDSSNIQAWRRRLRGNSSPRVYNFEDDQNNITLMTFATAVQNLSKKIGNGLRKSSGTLFVPRPKKRHCVRESDILLETKWICVDFIVSRLESRHLMSYKVGLTAPGWHKSVHVINAAVCLEAAHPETYNNVSKKLGITMNSRKIIRNTLTLLLAVLFERDITWGMVVSMFSVAGLFGEECINQGHADFIKDVVDVLVAFTDSRLLGWLVSQGGWDGFPVPGGGEKGRLSKLRLLLLICAASVVSVFCFTLLDVWG